MKIFGRSPLLKNLSCTGDQFKRMLDIGNT